MAHHSKYFSIGLALLIALMGCYVLGILSILCFGHIGARIFPCALLAGGATVCLIPGETALRKIDILGGVLLNVAISIMISCLTVDPGYDGVLYHQQIAAELADGWDIFRHPKDIAYSYYGYTWVICYAKGLELIGATICATLGGISVMRAAGIMLILATANLLYDFLGRLYPDSSWKLRLAVATGVIGNTVGMTQCLSTYNDYPLYYYILMTIIFVTYATQSNRGRVKILFYLLAGGVTVLAIATKFNTFFYQGIAIIFIIAWQLVRRRLKEALWLALTGACALIVGVLMAWNPYVTNLMEYGNPLFPIFGDGAIDIMEWNIPDYYTDNRFLNFLICLFRFGIPYFDNRCGTFGPTFPLMLGISAASFIIWRKKLNPVYAYAAVCALVSVFFVKDTWWVRYWPQFYISGIAATVAMLPFARENKKMRKTLWAILICAYINIGIGMAAVAKTIVQENVQSYYIEKEYRGREVRLARDLPHFDRYLRQLGITPVPAEEEEIERGVSIRMFFDDEHCVVILATPEESRRFVERGSALGLDFEEYLAE